MPKKLKVSLWLLSGLLAIALVTPFLLNVNRYKGVIIREVKQQTGLDVKIEGELSLFLIPQPRITIPTVTVLNPAQNDPAFVQFESATATISWVPLLKKRIVVSHLEIVKPKAYLQTNAEGKNNWDFLREKSGETPSATSLTSTSASGSKGWDVEISQAIIAEGRGIYQNNEQRYQIDDVNLRVKIDSLRGPFSANGSVVLLSKKLTIAADIGDLQEIEGSSVVAAVACDGHTLKAQGRLKEKMSEFSGVVTGRFDSGKFLPAGAPGAVFDVTAPMNADVKSISIKDLNISSAGETLTGNVSFDIPSQVLKTSLSGLTNAVKLKLRATPIQRGAVNLKVGDPEKLLAWFRIAENAVPAGLRGMKDISFQADYVVEDNKVQMNNLYFIAGDKELRGSLGWQEPCLYFDLAAPHGERWLETLGTSIKGEAGPLILKGSLTRRPQDLAFGVKGKALEVTFDTRGSFQPETQKFDAKGTLSHHNLNALLRLLDSPQNNLTLGSMELAAHLNGTPQDITIRHLDLKLHPKSVLPIMLNGQVKFGDLKKVNLNVRVGHVQLDQLQPASAQRQGPTVPGPRARDAVISGKQLKWSSDKLDLSFLSEWSGDIGVKIKQISSEKLDIRDLDLPIKIGEGQLNTSVQGLFSKGKMEGNLHLRQDPTQTLKAFLSVTDASMADLLKTYKIGQFQGGTMTIKGDITGAGNSLYTLMHNLEGQLDVKASGGHLVGDLFSFVKELNLDSVIRMSQEKNKENRVALTADMPIHQGILRLKDVRMTTPLGSGQATGHLNLGEWTLDTVLNLHVSELGIEGDVIIKAYGSLDQPKTDFKLPNISTTLLSEKGVQKIKKQLEKRIPGAGALLEAIPGLELPGDKKKDKRKKNKQKIDLQGILSGF